MTERAGSPIERRHLLLAAGAGALAAALVAHQSFASAPTGHFVVGSGALAGTVYDTKTKLTWQQVAPPPGYPWGAASTSGTAQNYCSALSLAGGGWRMPTVLELQSLVDYSLPAGPYIDSSIFPNTTRIAFWSASASVSDTTRAFYVGFDYAYVSTGPKTDPNDVRCVR
jgi:hypothetical protein